MAIFRQKCCSFSAVSAPIFAGKYAFCSIFQNLPDYPAENFEIWQYFANFATFAKILLNFHENCCFFKPIFCENFEIAAVQKYANMLSEKSRAKKSRLRAFFERSRGSAQPCRRFSQRGTSGPRRSPTWRATSCVCYRFAVEKEKFFPALSCLRRPVQPVKALAGNRDFSFRGISL